MLARLLALPIVIVMAIPVATGLDVVDASPAVPPPVVVDDAVLSQLATAKPTDRLTVIVRLREQASLGSARQGTRRQRQRAVVQALRATADASQQPLRSLLRTRRTQGRVQAFEPLWVSNSVIVTATPDVVLELAQRTDIESISPDAVDVVATGSPSAPAEPNVSVVGAPALWDLGYDGQGVVVAALDSGVDIGNPDLAANYRGGTNSWFDPYGQHATPTDLSGHGTATMGVAVGGGSGGTTVGIAPGATWIAGRVFNDAGVATASAIHLALQWVLDPDGDPTTPDAPLVVNNSWDFGTPGCNLEFQPDLQALRAAAIIPVFAAGHFGAGANTSVSPANYPEAVSVGATNNTDSIYAYSSRGPSGCAEPSSTFPDVVAPGVNVWTTDRNGLYSYWTGTSLAAPAVTGAIALLASTGQTSALAPDVALLDTAVDLGAVGADDVFGHGRIDVAAAYQELLAPPPTTTTTTTSPPTTSTSSTTTLPPTSTSTSTTTTSTTTSTPTTSSSTTSTSTTLPAGGGVLFADGFESGSTGAWSSAVTSSGRLSVTSAARLAGSFGLQARIVSASQMYVADTTPNAAASFAVGFQFDPNAVVLGSKTHDVLRASSASGSTAVSVQVRTVGGYQVRLATRLASGAVKYSSWTAMSDASHSIQISWVAASSSAVANGSLSWSIDGVAAPSLTNMANSTVRIDEVRLGPQGLSSGISGTEYYDTYTSSL